MSESASFLTPPRLVWTSDGQHPLDLFDELIGETGLGDERVAPGLARAVGMTFECVSGQSEDWNMPRAFVHLEPPGSLQPSILGSADPSG
jgi:hypothetical protein